MMISALVLGLALTTAAPTTIVPVSATIERTKVVTLANGHTLENTTSGKYYRDSFNRVRREEGPLVIISDPVQGTTLILDTRTKTGRRVSRPSQAPPSAAVSRSGQPTKSEPLGDRSIDGISTTGRQYVNVIPVNEKLGNKEPIEQRTQLWFSEALQLPLLTVISSPLSEVTVRMKIASKQEPDPDLFVVPRDYKIGDVSPAAR